MKMHIANRLLLLILSVIICPLLLAQESPLVKDSKGKKDKGEKEDELVFELSAFEVTVSDDRGYLATNSTSATSLDTEVRDLPMGIEIVTTEFIEDLQAVDMKEALSYSPGVFFDTKQNFTAANTATSRDVSPSSGVRANDFNDAVIIRGYTVPNQQRLGFRVGTIVPGYGVTLGGITDSANIERQEVVRGPQSLLYGINVLSGIVNFMPKRPLPEPRTSISFSASDDGFMRGIFDHTGPLVKNKLNYRVMGSFMEQDYEIEFKKKYHEYYVAQFDWFVNKKLKVFIEGQYADTRVEGVGQQYFSDGGFMNNTYLRNRFDERYTWGRDFFNSDVFASDMDVYSADALEALDVDAYSVSAGDPYLIQNPREGVDYSNAFVDLGPYNNISGPDTYRQREELDFTILANFSPLENLDLEAGLFLTDVTDDEFNVRLGTFNNDRYTINPFSSFGDAVYNPEFDLSDPIGRGIGELFLSPDPRLDHPNEAIDDTKYAYYMWYERPTSSQTFQARFRAAYTIETDWFERIPASHTFTGGLQLIEDDVSFVDVNWDVRPYYATNQMDPANNRLAEDPVIFRKSVFDYEPIRYDSSLGELAYVGRLRRPADDYESVPYLQRSGWYDVSLWYRGAYAVYHGKFFNDRLTLIAGLRQDSYQVKEQERLRVMDPNRETDVWQGYGQGSSVFSQTPYFVGYGDKPFEPIPQLSDSMNERVGAYYASVQESLPNGTTEYLFDDYTNFVTKTFGISFRLTEDLSTYYLYSEGIFPNTGLRDGAYQPFDAESTTSNELGLKFEFFDRKISGRISVWKIDRENAVWNWPQAPAPAKWWGGPTPRGSSNVSAFSPEVVDEYRAGSRDDGALRYGVAMEYVRLAYDTLGMEFPVYIDRRGNERVDEAQFVQWGGVDVQSMSFRDPQYENKSGDAVFVHYSDMKSADEASGGQNPLKLAMDLAVRNSENLNIGGFPIYYYGLNYDKCYAPSIAPGANVGYTEEGVGLDGQLILTPKENWQVILGYSYQKREVTSFDLVSGYTVDEFGNRGDELYTTEYDVWVMLLGPDNFEDPSNPATLKSGSINGVDLSFVPRTNYNLWTKYSFTEGKLDGFEVGGGLNYFGPTPTSVSIGGEYMTTNRYSTPDIPAYLRADLYLGYRFTHKDINWRLALNIYNLANTVEVEEIKTYPGEDRARYRRSLTYYDDRSFRISLSASF